MTVMALALQQAFLSQGGFGDFQNLSSWSCLVNWLLPPWEHGFSSLGHRLVYSKRVSQPFGVAIGSDVKLGDRDALAVKDYARAHPYEDVEASAISAEAGLRQSDTAPKQPSASPSVFGDDDEGEGAASSSTPDVAMPQPPTGSGDAVRSSHKHDTEHDDVGAQAKCRRCSG